METALPELDEEEADKWSEAVGISEDGVVMDEDVGADVRNGESGDRFG